jgi:hypothetical protein
VPNGLSMGCNVVCFRAMREINAARARVLGCLKDITAAEAALLSPVH